MTNVDTAVSPPRRRKRGPKPPRHVFDRRTRVGRRAVALANAFRQKLDVDASDPVMAAAITRAAEVTALAEHLRARALRGDPTASVDDALRLSRTAEAMTRRLIDRHKAVLPTSTLTDYLAARGGQP